MKKDNSKLKAALRRYRELVVMKPKIIDADGAVIINEDLVLPLNQSNISQF